MLLLRYPSVRTLVASKWSTQGLSLSLRHFESTKASSANISEGPRSRRRKLTSRTHLLTIPFYGSPALWSRMEELRRRLQEGCDKAHLEPGLIIPSIYHTLSLKLGNVNIKGFETPQSARPRASESDPQAAVQESPAFEREDVLRVLEELKEPIRQLVNADGGDGVLRVPLGVLRPLLHGRPETFNPRKVNVLFLQPAEGKGLELVQAVCRLVHERFTAAGMLAGDPPVPARPNMTLINTINRTNYVPGPGTRRTPFDLEALYSTEGFKKFKPAGVEGLPENLSEPLSVDLGVAEVRELHLQRVVSGSATDSQVPQLESKLSFVA